MQVEVEEIKSSPLKVIEDIDAQSWDLDSFDVKFINNIHLEGWFKRIEDNILVKVKVVLCRRIVCSRCLDSTEQCVDYNFDFHYPLSSLEDTLDIDNDVREEILLNFPTKVLCKPDCKGLCPHCGVNLNLETCECS